MITTRCVPLYILAHAVARLLHHLADADEAPLSTSSTPRLARVRSLAPFKADGALIAGLFPVRASSPSPSPALGGRRPRNMSTPNTCGTAFLQLLTVVSAPRARPRVGASALAAPPHPPRETASPGAHALALRPPPLFGALALAWRHRCGGRGGGGGL
ncbi:hypothetical protein DFH09DRAFT_167567 [Mycena vulgaris]|nr:hypothetical protein DFH09DRAFT_167567 [Mycena vulgaris]